MKKHAIIFLAATPLIAGCAGNIMDPSHEPEPVRVITHDHDGLEKQLRRLRNKLAKLDQRVKAQAERPAVQPPAPPRSATSNDNDNDRAAQQDVDLTAIRRRLAELETEMRARPAAPPSVSTTATTANGAPTEASLPADVAERFEKLNERLDAIASTQRGTDSRQKKMADDLDKDRVLVVDYLEDLDRRLAAIEDARGGTPQPTSPPDSTQPRNP